jgi:hypothetical protein
MGRWTGPAWSGYDWAQWHKRKRAAVTLLYGGIDEDVLEEFYRLNEKRLGALFLAYKNAHGPGPASYAKRVYKEWKSGEKQPSGQTLERLLALLPPLLTTEQQYELVRKLRNRYRYREDIRLSTSPQRWREEIWASVGRLLQRSDESSIPKQVQDRLAWITSGNMLLAQKLMRRMEAYDALVLLSCIEEEGRRIKSLLAVTTNAICTHTIRLPQGTIRLDVRRPRVSNEDEKNGTEQNALVRRAKQSLMDQALESMSQEELKELRKKAAEEALRLQVEDAKAQVRHQMSERDMEQVIEHAARLERQGSKYEMSSRFETASGETNVRIQKNNDRLIAFALVVAGLVLLVILLRG